MYHIIILYIGRFVLFALYGMITLIKKVGLEKWYPPSYTRYIMQCDICAINTVNFMPQTTPLILLDNLFIWKVATSTHLGNRVVNQSSLVISIMHMLPIVIGLPPPALGSIS